MKARIRFACINDPKNHIGNVHMICAWPIKGIYNVPLLAPLAQDLSAHKAGKMSNHEYTINLEEQLMDRMPDIVTAFLAHKDDHVYTYCCFCRPGIFCHRLIIFMVFLALNKLYKCGYTIDCF